MDVLDRIVGGRKPLEGNGHLPLPGLIVAGSEELAITVDAWEAVRLAREPKRPHALELIGAIFERFQELHGDRGYRDDPAIVGGIAELDGRALMVVGQQKGGTTEENILRNFGMPSPEGYRKAMRLYRLAEKFHLPLVTLIDTPGAYPGPEAEERGQAEAIARSIHTLSSLATPVIAIVIGEGGSGGALALGVGDVVLALQNAIYSVISPEGCAAILYRSATESERAARALKLAGPDLLRLGIVDALIPEPAGGAHADQAATAKSVQAALRGALERIERVPVADLLTARYERFRSIGFVLEPSGDGRQVRQAQRPWYIRWFRR